MGRLPGGVTVPVGLLGLGGIAALLLALSFLEAEAYRATREAPAYCSSCHEMRRSVQELAMSGHEALGCDQCHAASFSDRGGQALSALAASAPISHPPDDELLAACISCHMGPSADAGVRVDSLAGHRVHFESDLPELRDLTCLSCHVGSGHALEASTAGCATAGCHEDWRVRLGTMAHQGLECGECHALTGSLMEPIPFQEALDPAGSSCLACHEMEAVYSVPAHDPHGGDCGACHLPHRHQTPAEAAGTCTSGGCHTRPDTLTPMHRGLLPGVLQDCGACHRAHEYGEAGDDCVSCHQDIYGRGLGEGRADGVSGLPVRLDRSGANVAPLAAAGRKGGPAPVRDGRIHRVSPVGTRGNVALASLPVQVPPRAVRFRHAEHRGVDCLECHSAGESHGRLTVVTGEDCRTCHHQETPTGCEICHGAPGPELEAIAGDLIFNLSATGRTVSRVVGFRHGAHQRVECRQCHTGGLALSAAGVDCSGCHQEHHRASASCRSCHAEVGAPFHSNEVHQGCQGAGCHLEETPFRLLEWSRETCLVCHRAQEDHYRDTPECTHCHVMPHAFGKGRVGS